MVVCREQVVRSMCGSFCGVGVWSVWGLQRSCQFIQPWMYDTIDQREAGILYLRPHVNFQPDVKQLLTTASSRGARASMPSCSCPLCANGICGEEARVIQQAPCDLETSQRSQLLPRAHSFRYSPQPSRLSLRVNLEHFAVWLLCWDRCW